jgi:hypothetical protein
VNFKKWRPAGLGLAIALAAGVFSTGVAIGATLSGPFKWTITVGSTNVPGEVVLGPGGPYVASSAVAQLLGGKAVPDTAHRNLTFFQNGSATGQVPNPAGQVLLQNWPQNLVLEGNTDFWSYITPSNPVTTDDGQTFSTGIVSKTLSICDASPHATAGRVYITNGQYKSFVFSLGLPSWARNGAGYGLVEVMAGSTVGSMARVYTSPHVTKGFFTQRVSVPIAGAKLVEVMVYVWGPDVGCGSSNGVAVLLGNAAFVH